MSEIAIVIVNWNGKALLKNCLDSLRKQTKNNFKIILVDNGSNDGSLDFIGQNYPEIEMIALSKNTGFAKANNIGIKKALENEKTENILLLNNDTEAHPEFIEEMIQCANRYPQFGSIQAKILDSEGKNIDSTGILICHEMSAMNRGQGEEDKGQFEDEEEIFGSCACAAIYSRNALEKIKLPIDNYFDEDYFVYYEDVDLAWRIRLNGFRSYYCPKAKVLHKQSATGNRNMAHKKFYLHRNQYYNIIKNFPITFAIRSMLFMPIRYLSIMHSMAMKKGSFAENTGIKNKARVANSAKCWLDVAKNLPQLIRKRKIIQKSRKAANKEIKKWLKIYKADFRKIIYG